MYARETGDAALIVSLHTTAGCPPLHSQDLTAITHNSLHFSCKLVQPSSLGVDGPSDTLPVSVVVEVSNTTPLVLDVSGDGVYFNRSNTNDDYNKPRHKQQRNTPEDGCTAVVEPNVLAVLKPCVVVDSVVVLAGAVVGYGVGSL